MKSSAFCRDASGYPDFASASGLAKARAGREWLARLSDSQLLRLDEYIRMLAAWNRVCNLTGASTPQRILDELVVDSIFLARFLETLDLPLNPLCWDFGSGAGLPGIPLRIVWESGYYTMVEIREKRALFLANALARLGLARTSAFRGGVNDFFAASTRENCEHGADCIVSRAFMPWPKLLRLVGPMLRPNGKLVVLANTPPQKLSAGWNIMAQMEYPVRRSVRWFWALRHKADI